MSENKRKNNINWFPGHMTKAKREMEASLKLVDLIIEIRDARIPKSSCNPMLLKLINNKPHLIILSKKDKADDLETSKWIKHFEEDARCVSLDILNDNVTKIIKAKVKEIMEPWIQRQIRRGINPRAIRVMVSGIPNVGKSTLINRISKKKVVETADKPGVTKSLRWIKLDKDIELLDTPGILWPKFDDDTTGLNLAIIGSINDQILDMEYIGVNAMNYLLKNYRDRLIKRYNIDLSEDAYEVFKNIALSRKIYSKGEPDISKAILVFINEIRNDKLGPITWEKADE